MIKKNISIKGIPMDVYETIKKRAERNHRSVNSEIIAMLTKEHQIQNQSRYESILLQTSEIKKRLKGTLSPEEIREAIEEGRE